jgi:hypothetical protein
MNERPAPATSDPATSDHAAGYLETWFNARVRPVAVPRLDGGTAGGRWASRDELAGGSRLETLLGQLDRERGADVRTSLTCLTGWVGGPVARAMAAGVVRDGVTIRLAGPDPVRLYQVPAGYVADLVVAPLAVAVAADHPWSARPCVEVVTDRAALQGLAVAELTRWAAPLVEAWRARGRLSRTALWGQLADAIGVLPRLLVEAGGATPATTWIERVADLLAVPGAPWRHRPTAWQAQSAGGPVVVTHRGSCCLFFRAWPPADAEPGSDPLARSGADGPPYCGTCSLRTRDDVERRLLCLAEHRRADAVE